MKYMANIRQSTWQWEILHVVRNFPLPGFNDHWITPLRLYATQTYGGLIRFWKNLLEHIRIIVGHLCDLCVHLLLKLVPCFSSLPHQYRDTTSKIPAKLGSL
jgi:hypothetical protein